MIKPVNQKYLHKPEIGQHGDCWAACIATITNIPLEEIPNPNSPENKEWSVYWINMWEFLQKRGFNMYCESVANFKYDTYCIAVGKSPRSKENDTFYHAVVWKNGIVHDPHPDKTGIDNIVNFEIIESIQSKRH